MTNGLLISIAERYGNSDSVAKTGPDLAIEQATRNVAAAMFALIDDPQVSLDCKWRDFHPHDLYIYIYTHYITYLYIILYIYIYIL